MALSLITFLSHPSLVHANQEDESVMTYDQIVSGLNQSRAKSGFDSNDPFAKVKIHAGVAYVTSFITLLPFHSRAVAGFMNGFEANFGIDLFDPEWMSEFAFRSFTESELGDENTAKVSLREFDMKVIYRPRISRAFRSRFGAGLTGRYLRYRGEINGTRVKEDYTTPASIFLMGLTSQLGESFSVGAEIAYRSAMIDDTIDSNAIDGMVRVDFQF